MHGICAVLLLWLQLESVSAVGSSEDEPTTSSQPFGIAKKFSIKSFFKSGEGLRQPLLGECENEMEDALIQRDILESIRTWNHDDPVAKIPWNLSHYKTAEWIFRRGISKLFGSPLREAVRTCNEMKVKEILKETGNANETDMFKQTALHFLFTKEQSECPEITRIMIAIRLLRAGVDVNVANNINKRRALHYACMKDISGGGGPANTAMVELLTKIEGCDVNAKDADRGCSPLHYAAQGDNATIVTLLLERPDINISLQNKEGKSPLQYAMSGNEEVKRVFLEYMNKKTAATRVE